MHTITVQDILKRKGNKVVCVTPDASVIEAAQLMRAEGIGSVVVCENDKGVVGVFTERDVNRRVVAEGKDPKSTPVREVMSHPVACCKTTTTLKECQSVITQKRLRHLPVVENGELVGIISSGDIVAQESALQQSTIEYLHDYLHGRR